MGRWHADALTRTGGVLGTVYDPDAARATLLASRYPGASAAESLEQLFDSGATEVAHICTPTESHRDLVARALSAGMHVLVEKPIASTATETATLFAMAELSRRLLAPVHQTLFQPGMLDAERAVPELGKVLHIEAMACSAGADGESDSRRRQVALDILPHPLPILVRLFPAVARDIRWRAEHLPAGELRATGSGNGTSVSLLVSMRTRPTLNSVRILAERGTVHLDLYHGFAVIEKGDVSRARKITHPFTLSASTLWAAAANLLARSARAEVAYPGLRTLIARFYQAVDGGREAPISAREALAVATMRDAITTLVTQGDA